MLTIALRDRVIPHLFDQQVSAGGDRTFLCFDDRTYSYREAAAIIEDLSAQLHDQGVRYRSRVMLLMNNSATMVFVVLGLVRLGAVVVPVNTAARGAFLQYFLDDSQCSHLIADADLFDAAREAAENLAAPGPRLLVTGAPADHPAPCLRMDEARPLRRHRVSEEIRFHDTAFIIYTSGTTGRSKGVIASHAHAVSLGMVLPRQLSLTAEDRLLVYMPMFHASSLWSSIVSALLLGASVAVLPRFSASRFWTEARRLGATQFISMGGIAQILAATPPGPDDRNHSIRVGYAAPLPHDARAFEERFGVKLASGYGMTELPPVANSVPAAGYHDVRFAGPVQTEFSEVRIVDADDAPLAVGQIGEITVRPVLPWTSTSGYLNKRDESMEAWRNLWFHTGDLGRLDEQGNLYYEGRKRETIRRRGEFISPLELEEMLDKFPKISEVAAFPVPSEIGEDDVAVAVVPAVETTTEAADVYHFSQAHLPRYMVPRYIAVVDHLPRTPTGKVEKMRLREELLKDPSLLWDAQSTPPSTPTKKDALHGPA